MLFVVWIDVEALDELSGGGAETTPEEIRQHIEEALNNHGLEGCSTVEIKVKED